MSAALHDHLIRDLALFDAGVLERFLDAERLGSTRLELGAVIFARVVPVGASHQLANVTLVPPALHGSLAALLDTDPSPVEIAACFAASSASAP